MTAVKTRDEYLLEQLERCKTSLAKARQAYADDPSPVNRSKVTVREADFRRLARVLARRLP